MESSNNTPITPVFLRERIGKTQMDMAVSLKKTVGTISNWERGTKLPVFTSLAEVSRTMEEYRCTFPEFVEAFGTSQIRLSLKELKFLLENSGLTFEDWEQLSKNFNS